MPDSTLLDLAVAYNNAWTQETVVSKKKKKKKRRVARAYLATFLSLVSAN